MVVLIFPPYFKREEKIIIDGYACVSFLFFPDKFYHIYQERNGIDSNSTF